ncbi:MAG TPA: metal ABC transporter substrate-binding protein [Gemmatimonadales bacterium]|jgi:zinc/manganese transport system substrate-binding protein|nr:metal ABC transporter substrate-binding protein [Gemmatimonadales bacterium]
MWTLGILKTAAAALIAVAGIGAPAPKKLTVVATTPDLAALAREIGGDAVVVAALAKPTEDPHFVDAKPSHLVTLNRADVLIEGGAELELGWLPPLLDNARNGKIAAGAPGRIVASQGIRMLEVPATFDRSKGDVHSLGNPHFLVDPLSAKIVAGEIADHLERVDPANAEAFQANLKRFDDTIDRKLVEWQKLLAPFRGTRIVTYHKDFVYFAERFGLEIVEELEPKPGIAPSPAHLAKVISTMQTTKARVILVQPYQNRRTAETVARQTGAMVLDMPQQPGAIPNTATYFDVMDHLVQTLAAALGGKP